MTAELIAAARAGEDYEVCLTQERLTWSRLARTHTGDRLREWALPQLVDDAQLIVSELVTNAVVHTRTARLSLQLHHRGYLVVIVVTDFDPLQEDPVRPATRDGLPENGRGWGIVTALSSFSGMVRIPDGGLIRYAAVTAP